jgi:hypothetical protein
MEREKEENRTFAKRFLAWFGLGALIFGTFCGANMASGVYAAAYIVTLGGGWALVWLLMIFVFMTFFCIIGMDFAMAYKVDNYNSYYLALYGLQKPDANPALKIAVSLFFDINTLLGGLITVAACVALFAALMNTLLGVPTMVASIFSVLLFTVLTIYGAGFLRKFNTAMTISLLVCLVAILISVISLRGDVLASRIGNFTEGLDWSKSTLSAHASMMFSYCMTLSIWGASLCNYFEKVKDRKDVVGTGITIGVLIVILWALTSAIVLPFMPEVLSNTPILMICRQYLPTALTLVYWVVVVFSVVSTAPTFAFNIANRFSRLWKTEKVSQKVKFFTISLVFLIMCWFISGVGLMTIVQKGYIMLGDVALFAIVIPLLISIYRVRMKNRAERNSAAATGASV